MPNGRPPRSRSWHERFGPSATPTRTRPPPHARLPPGLPPGQSAQPRPAPWQLGLLAPLPTPLTADAMRSFCERLGNDTTLRDLRHYARHGRACPPPTPLDQLPAPARRALDGTLARAPPRMGDAYGNCVRAGLLLAPHAQYVEGLYADEALPLPRPHAWLTIDGHTVDPTYQVALPRALGPSPLYFGVTFPVRLAARVMLAERRTRPVALGPPRPPDVAVCEDALAHAVPR